MQWSQGYCSKKNSNYLVEQGLIDGIMLKVQKGQKLTERQREFNNLISKTRCLIERTLVWVSATYNNVVPLQAVLDKEESHIGSKDVACLQHTTISKTRTRRDR